MTINEFDDYISPMASGGGIGLEPDISYDLDNPWDIDTPTDDV